MQIANQACLTGAAYHQRIGDAGVSLESRHGAIRDIVLGALYETSDVNQAENDGT